MSALITREPKLDLKLIKRQVLKGMVGFGHLRVTLSNAWHAKKCVGSYCKFLMVMMHIDYGCEVLRGYFRPLRDACKQ